MTSELPTAPETPRQARGLRWRHAAYVAAVASALVIVVAGAGIWYASTPRFAARVHLALVATLERATGGKVEIGSFRWSVRHLAINVEDLTIHGKESPDQAPYFHVDHLTLHAKIISFLTPKIALASLTAERPTFHLILYPDGTTNQPQPRTASNQPVQQTLLNLAIDNTRVQNGLVLLNNRAVPWEMASGPLQLTMQYVGTSAAYQAELETRNITFKLKNATEAHSRLKARINLTQDALAVESLDLKTGHSRLLANAQLRNFSQPSWQVAVHGSIDAREIGAITGNDELRDGVARLNIQAHGEPGQAEGASAIFQVTGHVDLRSGEWESSWLRLRNVELHTNLIVDNDQCSLTGFSSVLDDGGKIAGSLIMKHCIGPAAPVFSPAASNTRAPLNSSALNRRKLHVRELLERLHRKHMAREKTPSARGNVYQPLEANLQAQVSDVTLPLILAATAPKEDRNIGFTTATSGEVTAHWTGDGHGLDVHGNLTMRAPRRLLGLIPVSGSAHADYLGDHRHLVIDQVDETTPATQVHGAGTLTLLTNDKNSALHLDVLGRDLGEFDQLLTMLDLRETPKGQPHALPLKLLGNADFHGDIHGSYFALEAVGHLDSQGFEMVVAHATPPGNPDATPPVHLLTWDQFHADVSYAPSRLIVRNAELVRGDAVVHTTLDLLPHQKARDAFTYDKRTHIAATLQTNGASISDLQSVLGSSYPAAGELTANGHVTGVIDNLDGAGHLALTNGVIQGQGISNASIQLSAHGHALEANRIQLAAAGGTAAGQLTYDYETGALEGQLTGQQFALEKVAALKTQRFPVGGTLGFHVQAAGTTSSPIATGTMQVDSLSLDQQSIGRVHAKANLQHGILSLTSRADLFDAHLDASGQVQLNGNYPAEARLTFTGFNVDPLLRTMTSSGIRATSSLEGGINMSGPLKQLSAIRADANLKPFSATVNRRPIQSAGPVDVSLRDGKVQLKPVHIRGKDMDLLSSGTVDLLDHDRLRIHAEGSIDAGLATAINPNIQSTGQIQFVVNARGTAQQPDLRGRAQVSHVNIHMLNVTNGLTDMNGQMLFDQDRLVVQQLNGSSGGGQLQMSGFVGYRNGIFVDLTAITKDVRIRYPKGVSSSADAKLRLLGTSDNLLLSGNVKVMRFGIGSSVDLASLAGSGSGVSAPIDLTSPLNRVRLDIHVTSAPELGFQNSFASLAGDINLRVRGTLENPSVLGRIDISQGSASFAGTTYRLQQGDIVFANPVTISPQINLEASARVQNYDIIISLHGPPSKLDISYRSEPPLTQADVLALLALGRTNEQATMYGEQQQAGANLTSEALLGGALNAAVSSRVQKLFGVGSVRVDPNFVGTLGESTARVTVEEQVGRSLTLTFATNVNTTAQQLIQAQYDVSRNLSIIAVRDEANVFSMYLQIRAKHK
jgi:translocation and assembly module TamB